MGKCKGRVRLDKSDMSSPRYFMGFHAMLLDAIKASPKLLMADQATKIINETEVVSSHGARRFQMLTEHSYFSREITITSTYISPAPLVSQV